MKRAERRHQKEVWKKRKKGKSKCNRPHCIYCHADKVLGIIKASDAKKIATITE